MTAIVTAYIATCLGCSGLTYSGKIADYKENIIAADLKYWNIGQQIELCTPECKIYTIEDTGSAIQGKNRFDILVASYEEAIKFGRRSLKFKIVI